MGTGLPGGLTIALRDGRQLRTGGDLGLSTTGDCEIVDGSGQRRTTSSMLHVRQNHAAVQLADGRVLVTGGGQRIDDQRGASQASCEMWDPSSEVWSEAAPMRGYRREHVAVLLDDGHVFVCGGLDNLALDSCESYNPRWNRWRRRRRLPEARFRHTSTRLPDGSIRIEGGERGGGREEPLPPAVYDPGRNRWA